MEIKQPFFRGVPKRYDIQKTSDNQAENKKKKENYEHLRIIKLFKTEDSSWGQHNQLPEQ